MRNITVSVDNETHRIARIRAAELDTSVSALVRNYLRSLALGRGSHPLGEASVVEAEAQPRRRRLLEVIEEITADGGGLRMSENLSREELYDQTRSRA